MKSIYKRQPSSGDAAMKDSLYSPLKEAAGSDQVTDQVSDQVKRLLPIFENQLLSAVDLMYGLKLSHRFTFRKNYLHPALKNGLIEMTVPDKPNSRLQKYKITAKCAGIESSEIDEEKSKHSRDKILCLLNLETANRLLLRSLKNRAIRI